MKFRQTLPAVERAAHFAKQYLERLPERRVFPDAAALKGLAEFEEPLPESPTDPLNVIDMLHTYGSPATVATAGPRYFGFVTGGALPAALGANVLAAAWDQSAFSHTASPVAAKLEEIALGWLLELLHLPRGCAGAFVTGTTMAHVTALAAARSKVLADVGYDVDDRGLVGAPPITVVVGEEAHATLFKALAIIGLGRKQVISVPVDLQGRMRPVGFPTLDGPTIVCIQAGNVNSGAFDPAEEICEIAHDAGAWVHADGAFGLWALAAPGRRRLAAGYHKCDSWALDAHKWLNVPYDSGLALVRHVQALKNAMRIGAAYLLDSDQREPFHFTPESSRRARGVEIWAALKSLGRDGVADLVERCCEYAALFAGGLKDAGFEVLNDVVLNQVVVSFGSEEKTARVIRAIEEDGAFWAGGTNWQGRAALRISVSSWATERSDIKRSLEALARIAKAD
ncbi:MAG TPA: aminotransferase class V-fold PLP-dependent enzyme [candidate division Zixibacteria bacterium]|nr:aminotransferase class V-fold PLP-dependent enzyme [candidate division Zixibacteria bacterium]